MKCTLNKKECEAALIHYDIVKRYLEFQLKVTNEDEKKVKKRLEYLEKQKPK